MTMENLNENQNARADALLVARKNLGTSGLGGNNLPERFTVEDLVDLAEWVFRGKHPLADYGTREDVTHDGIPAGEPIAGYRDGDVSDGAGDRNSW